MKIRKYDKLLWSNGEQFRLKYNSYIFNNGYRIINWISRGYVELEKLVKVQLSQKVKKYYIDPIEFKTVNEALDYLKNTKQIKFKEKLLNQIQSTEFQADNKIQVSARKSTNNNPESKTRGENDE